MDDTFDFDKFLVDIKEKVKIETPKQVSNKDLKAIDISLTKEIDNIQLLEINLIKKLCFYEHLRTCLVPTATCLFTILISIISLAISYVSYRQNDIFTIVLIVIIFIVLVFAFVMIILRENNKFFLIKLIQLRLENINIKNTEIKSEYNETNISLFTIKK
ncbi:hypothetical protein ABRY17_06250 [Clostridioides difficile]